MAQFNAFEEAIDFSSWKEIFEKQGKTLRYRRGEYFIRTGEIMRNIGWIKSGSFKHSLIDNAGTCKAVGFVFEGSILANYVSTIFGKKMPTDIIAMEDSEVIVVPTSIIRRRVIYDPTLHIRISDALFQQAYEHALNDYRYTALERYRLLLKRHSRLFEVASLENIATYLNISRRQLHRIRETIANEPSQKEKSIE